jgi:hypothetical protein
MRLRILRQAALLGLLLTAACRDETDEKPFKRPMLVSIDPARLEGVTCADAPGALRTYVATLTDTTPFIDEPVVSSEVCEDRCWAYDAEGEYLGLVTGTAGAGATLAVAAARGRPGGDAREETFVSCTVACDPVASRSPTGALRASGRFAFVAVNHRNHARFEGNRATIWSPSPRAPRCC